MSDTTLEKRLKEAQLATEKMNNEYTKSLIDCNIIEKAIGLLKLKVGTEKTPELIQEMIDLVRKNVFPESD